MHFDTIIKNGIIVTGSDSYNADIGIQNGKISYIDTDLTEADKIIDANGKYIFPGGIDVYLSQLNSWRSCRSRERGNPENVLIGNIII